MHGVNWRSRNPMEFSGTENSALCLADRTAQSIRRRSENTYAIDLRDATLACGPIIVVLRMDLSAPDVGSGALVCASPSLMGKGLGRGEGLRTPIVDRAEYGHGAGTVRPARGASTPTARSEYAHGAELVRPRRELVRPRRELCTPRERRASARGQLWTRPGRGRALGSQRGRRGISAFGRRSVVLGWFSVCAEHCCVAYGPWW